MIEDDPYAREALALLLDYYGYDVVAASNGSDGLALVTEYAPDLVVTDWRMPGLSGLALCVALRERRDTMPIIVVTSEVHDVPKLANVARPIVLAKRVESLFAEAPGAPFGLNQVFEEGLRQQLDVVTAIAQRRKIDLKDLQPVVEIGPQLSVIDRLLHVRVLAAA